ncbi:dioxygenase family protein [Pontibacter virosus]|uniref:Protocatechuate 3,4-dioxygenase beta subunit n=1 Tax=Pontibacter virosus TaxID=1765052 RepID=A0A2U1AT61_9BACT|nr:intradiol ring-cleavage dioxygenase [Pontibacter virosus]PVY39615.1 protocatechuate 3,4-dioxygenase beta subunit [Pontibacter virosus]
MKETILLYLLLSTAVSCQAQDKQEIQQTSRHVGGPCEGCEALLEYGDKQLTATDTLPGFHPDAQDKLKLTGTVYLQDGKTLAPDVILYIYHTDETGIYPTKGDEKGWARRHGYLRGWIKTGADGRYTFYTTKPGSYPSRSEPAHIHLTVKEPDKNVYYLDDFLFEGDPLLTARVREARPERGGSGIVALKRQGNYFVVKRDITLGLHIPDYNPR